MEKIVEEIFGLYKKYGAAEYIGEPVSQLEHMSQSAELAMKEGYDDEVVLAAFFHDIGHICVASSLENSMDGYGVRSHEKIGADFLRSKGFGEKIASLVENHVQAKRYLTYRYPAYFSSLSDASKKTLEFQGGIMTPEEASRFQQQPYFRNQYSDAEMGRTGKRNRKANSGVGTAENKSNERVAEKQNRNSLNMWISCG